MAGPNIKEVLALLNIPFNGYRVDENFKCIFCDDPHKHMNINFNKNVWKCPRCGKAGGALRLYAEACNLSLEQAAAEISKKKGCSGWNDRAVFNVTAKDNSTRIAYDGILNRTYTALLDILSLDSEDEAQLISRGLSRKDIIEMQFKSTVEGKNYEIAKRLMDDGCTLKGVAGFVEYNGEWCFFCNAQGILIPYKNISGKILGFQIRKRDETKNKYLWLSTASICQTKNTRYTNGCKSKTTAHVVGYEKQCYIYLTEGAL